MKAESVRALERAEAIGNLSQLSKGNALRRAADDKELEILETVTLIESKKKEIDNM